MKFVIEEEPLAELLYLSASPRGGAETRRLPILGAVADDLPEDVSALLICSDLQGVAPLWEHGGESLLLGEVLAEYVAGLVDEIPALEHLGVILAGDYFSSPGANKRGATGDVTSVWAAFSRIAQWVVGVQGNHDLVGRSLERPPNCHLLDGRTVKLGGGRFGGVGLVGGQPGKTGRRDPEDQLRLLRQVLREKPDLLILHEGPPGADRAQPGNAQIGAALPRSFEGTLVCGHVHWPQAASHHGTYQVLNVDSRVILATRSPGPWPR
jgi:Icc protein